MSLLSVFGGNNGSLGTATAMSKKAVPNPEVKLRDRCSLAQAENETEARLEHEVAKTMDRCEAIIGAPGFNLPMLPSSSLRLMDLLQSANCPVRQLSEVVSSDPVLAGKFLHLANSAFYGGRTRIDSVQAAVSRLGLGNVKNVVMSISLNSTIFKDKRLSGIAQKLWAHSICCASATRVLAAKVGAPPDAAYMAGLLHDIGKIPALLLIQNAMNGSPSVREAFVDSLIERHHVRSGIALLEHWQLPAESRLAVAAHHAVANLADAQAQVALRLPSLSAEERTSFGLTLASATLADRALATAGYAEEPDEVNILKSRLAAEVGLNEISAMEYLNGLPKIVNDAQSVL